MNLINVISTQNIADIKAKASEILALLKAKKLFLTCEYQDDRRIKGSDCLVFIHRAFNDDRFNTVTGESDEAVTLLNTMVHDLAFLLANKSAMMGLKVSDYTKDPLPRLCREIVPYLDDMYIQGDITLDDINDLYKKMGKAIPNKFSRVDLDNKGEVVYAKLSAEIADNAQEIKARMISHYESMVTRIDPDNSINDMKDFIKAGKKVLSCIHTLSALLAFKFDNERFLNSIHREFEVMIMVAASKIADNAPTNDTVDVTIHSVQIGGKGFDVRATVNGKSLYARAITAEGPFVRLHYRYIIS